MDASSLAALQRLVALGRRSLLQYVSDSCPFATAQSDAVRTRILAAAAEEQEAIARLTRVLQKKHVRPFVGGSYPAHFTQFNFITIESLVPKLLAENKDHLVVLEHQLNVTEDPEARALVQAYLDMKRRHFQVLNDALAPQPSSAI